MTRREQIKTADLELKMNFSNHNFEFVSGLSEGFHRGANWADRTMLDKVCEWLKEHFTDYVGADVSLYDIHDDELVEDLKKAMQE